MSKTGRFPGKKFFFEASAPAWVSSPPACPPGFRPACPHSNVSQFLKIRPCLCCLPVHLFISYWLCLSGGLAGTAS